MTSICIYKCISVNNIFQDIMASMAYNFSVLLDNYKVSLFSNLNFSYSWLTEIILGLLKGFIAVPFTNNGHFKLAN